MAKCHITGMHKVFGHSRTFSMKANNRSWKPNLQSRRLMVDGKLVRVMVSARALRTMAKTAGK